jgi:hypothetical protein
MTIGRRSTAAQRWRQRARIYIGHIQLVAFVTLLADVFYRVAVRARVRRALGV